MFRHLFRHLCTLGLLTSSLLAQAPSWMQAKVSSSPAPRLQHAMAYDGARSQVVLFGGRTLKGGVSSDTWVWDGKNWNARRGLKVKPGARIGHSMAYDAARKRVVLFGGTDGYSKTQLGDTWLWDGKSWTRVRPLVSPSGRMDHSMVYDSVRQRIVLFGGLAFVNNRSTLLNDTWLWDGKTWAPARPLSSPPARSWSSMVFDGARRQVVLFGGYIFTRRAADTWLWNGTTWTQAQSLTSPGPRSSHAMAYDAVTQRVVLFSGFGAWRGPDTWLWNGKAWTQARPLSSPDPRYGHGMTYDAARQQVVLFGGISITNRFFDDTWSFSVRRIAGTFKAYGRACGASPLPLLASPSAGLPNIGKRFVLDVTLAPSSSPLGLLSMGASRTKMGNASLPLSLSSLGMTGCALYQSHDVAWPFAIRKGAGQITMSIPNQVSLFQSKIYLQAFISARGANPANLISTNAGTATIGNR